MPPHDAREAVASGDLEVPPATGPDAEEGVPRSSYGKGLAFASGSFVSTVLLSIASSVVTARLYGIDVVGQYALVMAPYILLSQISSLREQVAFVRRVSLLPRRSPEVPGLLTVVTGFSTLLTVVVGIAVGALNALVLNTAIGQSKLLVPSLIILVSYVLFENVGWNFDMIFAAYGAGKDLFFFRMIVALAFTGAAILLWFSTSSVWGLVIAQVASMAMGLLVRIVVLPRYVLMKVRWPAVRESLKELPGMLRFGVSVTPGAAATSLAYQSMVWSVGAVASTAAVGAFSRALGLAGRLTDAGFRINEMMFPQLVRSHEDRNHEEFARAFATGLRLIIVGLLGIAGCGAGAAVGVLTLLFGAEFATGANALSVLLFAMVLFVVTTLVNDAVVATGRPLTTSGYAATGAVITIVALFVLTPSFGGVGAGCALLLGAACQLILVAWRERRELFSRSVEASLARSLASAVMACAVAFLVSHTIDRVVASQVLSPLLALSVSVVCYLGVFVGSGGLSLKERERATAMVRGRLGR